MKCRKILIILVMAVFIFGMAGVCASDVNDTVIAGEDDSAVELSLSGSDETFSTDENELFGQSENDEVISEVDSGTFAELQANITAAKQGSTLTLTKNYEREDGSGVEGINIDKSITIDGNGFKIDAKGNSRIFKITADNVVLKNISFANAKTTEKGVAVFFEKSGIVTNCNFTNNLNGGSAVFFTGKGQVTNCNFAENYADYGSAIYFSDLGDVTNCNFTDNGASKEGGAVYFHNNGVLRNCNFIKSTSKNNGGAVFFEKSGNVTNCNFTDSASSNAGGAVYFVSDGNVTNCNFNNNTAKMGNAIYINSNHCTVSDCDFTNNPITKGAIHSVTGDITLSNNIIDAVQGRNFTEIQKLIDTANDGDEITIDGLYEGFGIPIRITKSLTLIGQNNATLDAKELSKILYITTNNVIIKNIQFTNAKTAGNGGAVFFEKSGTVQDCNFTSNEATGDGSCGGAIYFNGAGNVLNSIFTANRAAKNGGAIYVEGESKNNNFSGQFYNNYAGQSGGAIFFHNSVQNNDFDCIFKDNYASYGGAMFFSKSANANRFTSDFINNTGKSCGGAMFFYSTTDGNNFTGSFINNSALGQIDSANGNGGAITFKNVSSNSIFNCDFINNTAVLNGGAVNYRETPKNILFNANFTNNKAQRGGGVNFFETFEGAKFNGQFTGNSAQNGGALAAAYGSVEDISFTNNHADEGGAVYLERSGSAVNCNFTGNRATRNGGAVFINKTGNVVNCSFENNSASRSGGAVDMSSGNVKNSNFTSNAASISGGAVHITNLGNMTNCHFDDNSASNGGAVYLLNDGGKVTNCSFVANTAVNNGGAIFFMPLHGDVTNCYFEANSANRDGAIYCRSESDVTFDSVILKTDSDTLNTTRIRSPILNVYDFYSVYGSGEKLTFDLTTNRSMPITDGNISMTIFPKDNSRGAVNYTCLSGEGWTVDLPVGSYVALINTEYANFTQIDRSIEITMPDRQFYINVNSAATTKRIVNITAKSDIPKNLLWDGNFRFILPDGTQINATYGGNDTWWAMHTFDEYVVYQVNATCIGLDKLTVKNATIAISKPPVEITVANSTVEMFVSDSVTTGAALDPAGAGNLTYTVSNSSVVKVEDGMIIALGQGKAVITVSFAGNGKYSAAENRTIEVTVNLRDASVSVNNATVELFIDDNFTLVATTSPEGLNVTFTQDNSGVISIDKNGKITALKQGNATVKVSVGGDGVYALNTTDVKVAVKKIHPVISAADSVDMKIGDVVSLNATLNSRSDAQLNFTSTNESVVTVNDVGELTALSIGSANITVSFAGDERMEAAESKIITVTVSRIPTTIVVYGGSVDICIEDEHMVSADLIPRDAGWPNYESSDESVVSVEPSGIITGNSEGTAVITVSFSGNGMYEPAESKSIHVTVHRHETSIDVVDKLDMKVGDVVGLNATLTPPEAGELDYTSGNESVVSVNGSGEVTAVGEGSTIINVSFRGDSYYAPSNKSILVTVSKFETSIDVVDKLSIKAGDVVGLNATLTPPEAGELDYTSSDESVVTVNGSGQLTAVNAGSAIVTVRFTGNDKYAAAESKNILVVVGKVDTVISAVDSVEMKVGDMVNVNASLSPSEAGELDYASGDVSVVIVNNIGELIGVGEGSAIVTVKFTGSDKYAAAESKSILVVVGKVDTVISAVDSVEMKVGDMVNVNASLSPSEAGELDYASGDVSVVIVNNIGELIGVGEGSAIVTVKFTGSDKYAAAESKSILVVVAKTSSKLSDVVIVENNVTMTLSDAYGNPISGANISYTVNGVSNTTVSDANGSFMIIGEPGAEIVVNYVGSEKFLPSNITITLDDVKPVVRSASKFNITDGTGINTYTVDYNVGERGHSVAFRLTDDEGNPIVNATVGFAYKTVYFNRTTDENGIVSIGISTQVSGEYLCALSYLGDDKHNATFVAFYFNIQPKPMKIVASAKTFKSSVKTKKYTITLKTGPYNSKDGKTYLKVGKKVTLKINGKTYTAKTNSKGKATFKITKLTKKGKFTAKISFVGDKTYKAVSKNVKITIK